MVNYKFSIFNWGSVSGLALFQILRLGGSFLINVESLKDIIHWEIPNCFTISQKFKMQVLTRCPIEH
jgi:hypothetical protein